ncbi:hypothetical protein NDN08_004238 [Rhodosorus marinus]|uniref:Uncharacterized protein n=1 Tax=Rhodosorus marinus TaxID=101924 RepID=A0AAV8UKT7_9RHOD|nr:hypothetical protein NDN08_004238 [Rhodosorus marinus]
MTWKRVLLWSVLVLWLSIISDAVPCSQPKSSVLPEHLNTVSRQAECDGVGPLPDSVQLENIPGFDSNCVKLGDILTLPATISEYALSASGDQDSSAMEIVNDIIAPVQVAIEVALQSLTNRANNNICFGNFAGGDLKAEADIDQDPMMYNKCKELPVMSSVEWSVFAFAITTPFPGCVTEKSSTAAFCAAVSICPDTGIPSATLAINGAALECLGQDMSVFSGGITAGLSKVASYGLDFVTFGFSLSNSLVTKVYLYTGQDDRDYKLIDYEVHGVYQDTVKLKLKLEKWNLPKVLDLSGSQKRIVSVKGLENVEFEDTVKAFEPGTDSDGWDTDMLDLLESITDVTLQAALSIQLKMKFKFSAIPGLGKILPDSNSMTLGDVDMFFTTGTVTPPGDDYKDMVLKPGVYAFAGSNAVASVLVGILEYALQFVGSILDLFDWLPFKIDASDLIPNFDVGASDSFAFGFTANTDCTAIMLNVPLIFDFLGYVTLECKTDYSSFRCSVTTEFNSKFFEAIGEAIEEGVLWIINETDEFFNNIGNTIGAAFEDAVEGAVSAFSEDNLKATAKLISKGALSIANDIKDELEGWGKWCETAFDDFGDAVADLAAGAVNDICSVGKSLVDEAEEALNDLSDALEDAAEYVGNLFSCSQGSIIQAIAGCSDCCEGMEAAVKVLEEVGNDIEDAIVDIMDGLTSVMDDFANGGFDESQSYEKTTIDEKDTYGCNKVKVEKVTKEYFWFVEVSESRKTVAIISDEDCVTAALEQAKIVVEKYNSTAIAQDAFQTISDENKDAVFGASITADDLLEFADLSCSSELERDQVESGTQIMPVTVTCSANSIGSDGSFTGDVVTISQTGNVDMSNATSRGEAVSQLWDDVKAQLAEEITPTVARTR